MAFPDVVPWAVALTTFETKVSGLIPAAMQFALRVAGAVPWPTKLESHGSFENSKEVDEGRNSSVTAGARIDRVLLPRNCTSWTGDQISPAVQVSAVPAIELSTRRMAPSNSRLWSSRISCAGANSGICVSAYTSLV